MPRVSLAPPSLCLDPLPLPERLLPSLPPTVRDVDVPPRFRERFILCGYRPVGLSWRCYVRSLFQIHNETLSVWSHLLAAICMITRFTLFAVLRGGGVLGFRLQGPEGQGFSVDMSSLPLVLYVSSAVIYLSYSAAARLLHSRSQQTRHSLRLLDAVVAAVHQYAAALALSLYSSDSAWRQSSLRQGFLPAAALLAWLSCATCCYAELHFHRAYPLHRKLCQVVTMGLNISSIGHRLATATWTTNSALSLHLLQVVLFLLSAFFFSSSIPERFSPGRFDIVGHGHQLAHIMLSFGTLAQQEALFEDFLWRRPAVLREFGEERLLVACVSFLCVTLCCLVTAIIAMTMRGQRQKL